MFSLNKYHRSKRQHHEGQNGAEQYDEPWLGEEIVHMLMIYRISANDKRDAGIDEKEKRGKLIKWFISVGRRKSALGRHLRIFRGDCVSVRLNTLLSGDLQYLYHCEIDGSNLLWRWRYIFALVWFRWWSFEGVFLIVAYSEPISTRPVEFRIRWR